MIGGLCVPFPDEGTVTGLKPPEGTFTLPCPAWTTLSTIFLPPLENIGVAVTPFWIGWATAFFAPDVIWPLPWLRTPAASALLVAMKVVVVSAAAVRTRADRIFAILVIVVSWCVVKSLIALSWSGDNRADRSTLFPRYQVDCPR